MSKARDRRQRYDRCRTVAGQVGFKITSRNKCHDVFAFASGEAVRQRITLEELELFLAGEEAALVAEGGGWS